MPHWKIEGDPRVTGCDSALVGDLVEDRDTSVMYVRIGTGTLDFTPATSAYGGGGGASLNVQEADGSPAYATITALQFYQTDGFVVTQPAANTAKVSITGIPQANVASLVSDLAGKAASSHTHAESDVTNLVSDLAGKAASSHTHAESDVTNLTTDLAAKVNLAGTAGGQSINGGTASGETLTLLSTAHATKGKILFGTSAYDEVNNRLGVGTASPASDLTVSKAVAASLVAGLITNSDSSGWGQLGVTAAGASSAQFQALSFGSTYAGANPLSTVANVVDSVLVRCNSDGGMLFSAQKTHANATLRFCTNGTTLSSALRLTLDNDGNVVLGAAALATGATNGFFWLGSCAGTPTGVPAGSYAGRTPLVFDSTNGILYAYTSAAWAKIVPAAHATTHVSGGSDSIKLDDFAAPDDNTDLNASTSAHGLLLKATAPASGLVSVVAIGNGETAYTNKALFDTTNPAALGSVGPGTQLIAARRDHIHALPALDALAAATDITTANASTTIHGLAPKATAPASGLLSVLAIGNGATVRSDTAIFDTTNPAALGSVGPGTQLVAARRDHIHANPAIDTLAAATDITTLNASTSAHGLVVKATAPAANVLNVVGIANGETAYTNKTLFDGTNPAALGAVAPGTSLSAAHRDHVHANPAIDTLAAATDITTLDASTSAHGLVVKATAPASGLINFVGITNAETAYTNKPLFDTTNPAALGTVGPGTQVIAARRDHIHANPAIDTLAAATDIATLNSSTSTHGLLKKLSNVATEYMDGTGAWSTPPSGVDINGTTAGTTVDPILDKIIYYDASAAANRSMLPYIGWVKSAPIIDQRFFTTAAPTGWTFASLGAIATSTSTAIRGVPNGAGDGRMYYTDNALILFGGAKFRVRWIVNVTALQQGTLYIGFSDVTGSSTDAVDGAYFRGSSAVNGGEWEGVTSNNSSRTVTDSNTLFATGTHVIEVAVNAAASSCAFILNGTTIATNVANIPSGAGRQTGIYAAVSSGAGNPPDIVIHRCTVWADDALVG